MTEDRDDIERLVARSLHERYPLMPVVPPTSPSIPGSAPPKLRSGRSMIAFGSGLAVATAAAAIVVAVEAGSPVSTPRNSNEASAGASAGPSTSQTAATPLVVVDDHFRLFVHCGVPNIDVLGRAWAPMAPVPTYPGSAPASNGITTDDGYAVGVLRRVGDSTLRFDGTNSAKPFAVTFTPAPPPSRASSPGVCA